MSRQDDLKRLVVSLRRRRQRLTEQAAAAGPRPPAYLPPEITDVEQEIARLEAELIEETGQPLSQVIWPDPLPPTARQVFICYFRQDGRFGQTLAADLERAGLAAWWDIAQRTGSEAWRQSIEAAIEASQACVVVLTPDSVASVWVEREYRQALDLGLEVVAVLYQKCEPPPALTERQIVNFVSQPYLDGVRELLPWLGATTDHLPATLPPPPIRPRRRAWPVGALLALLVIVIALAAAGWAYAALFGGSGEVAVTPPPVEAATVALADAVAVAAPSPTPPAPTPPPTASPVPPTATLLPPVPTATPSPTATAPPPSATPTASPEPLAATATASATATVSPTASVSATASRTPSPTVPRPAVLAAPVLLAPAEEAVIQTGILNTFRWEWAGTLPADRYFEIRLWRAGEYKRGAFDAREVTTRRVPPDDVYEFTGDVASAQGLTSSGTYLWDVAIVSLEPYRVVGRQATPRPLNIVVASDSGPSSSNDGPEPTPTP